MGSKSRNIKSSTTAPTTKSRTTKQSIEMAKFFIVLAPIIASAFADDGYAAPAASYGAPAQAAPSYNAPDAGYGAPDSGYGVPDTGYGAPDTGYGAPDAGYGAPAEYGPPGYDAPASGYGAVIEEEGAGLGSTL